MRNYFSVAYYIMGQNNKPELQARNAYYSYSEACEVAREEAKDEDFLKVCVDMYKGDTYDSKIDTFCCTMITYDRNGYHLS